VHKISVDNCANRLSLNFITTTINLMGSALKSTEFVPFPLERLLLVIISLKFYGCSGVVQ
jgi:hypothetical protein